MKKIKLTGYARSSIEMELEIFTDRLGYGLKPGSPEYTELAILDGYTDGEYLPIPDNPTIKKALADVLLRLSNGEDGFAEESKDPDEKRMARAASKGLGTLDDKVRFS